MHSSLSCSPMRGIELTPNQQRPREQRSFIFLTLAAFAASTLLAACGSGPAKTTTTTTTTPPPATYPSVPPVTNNWSPSSSPLPAPAAVSPQGTDWANGATDFPLTVSSPTANATLTSPIKVAATASPTNPIFFMRVFVDQLAVYFTFDSSINTQIFLAPGAHTITVYAQDNQGYISATPIPITISAQAPSTNGQTQITSIQAAPGWQSCGAKFPPGSGRAGQICAAGGGTPTFSMTQNQSSPAMDGNSTEFSIAPSSPDCPGYCNELSFNPVAGGNNVSHFIYDVYFYIDNPDAPQALEFDINQTYSGQRWVWGSECNFNGDGVWDIWNDAPNTGWQPTNIPCLHSNFQANTWNHLTWDVQQNGNQVQYNTLTVNGTVYPVNTIYPNEQNWTLEEIDVAFQEDLNEAGDPYNVWLDEVSLTAY